MELMNRRLLAAQSKNVAYKACTVPLSITAG